MNIKNDSKTLSFLKKDSCLAFSWHGAEKAQRFIAQGGKLMHIIARNKNGIHRSQFIEIVVDLQASAAMDDDYTMFVRMLIQ
jgi:hypothetical protein